VIGASPKLPQAFFQVLGLGEKHPNSMLSADNYLELSVWAKPISTIARLDDTDYWRFVHRASFPYDIFTETDVDIVEGSDDTRVVFAHGLMDMDSGGTPLVMPGCLIYAHVNSAQHPSGLLLQRRISSPAVDHGGVVWTRVGVATIFTKTGDFVLESVFHEHEKPRAIVIV
jgi:hypothetical protein